MGAATIVYHSCRPPPVCSPSRQGFSHSGIQRYQRRRGAYLSVTSAAAAAPPETEDSTKSNGSTSTINGTFANDAAPASPPQLLAPPAAYLKAVETGAAKAALPAYKTMVMGVLAGVYIGFGGLLTQCIGAACPGLASSNPGLQKMVLGAFGLPFGLLLVLICGAELFTGNTALVTVALFEGKASPSQLARNWAVSYAGNLIGSLLLVALVACSGLLASSSAPLAVAAAKTSANFAQAFTKGVLANWLVCLAVWQAGAATTLPGKAVAVWFPISAFVAMGMEHSVANMFLVPMGIALGSPVTWHRFLTANLIPVTLGNMFGGIVCVAAAYYLCFGSWAPKAA